MPKLVIWHQTGLSPEAVGDYLLIAYHNWIQKRAPSFAIPGTSYQYVSSSKSVWMCPSLCSRQETSQGQRSSATGVVREDQDYSNEQNDVRNAEPTHPISTLEVCFNLLSTFRPENFSRKFWIRLACIAWEHGIWGQLASVAGPVSVCGLGKPFFTSYHETQFIMLVEMGWPKFDSESVVSKTFMYLKVLQCRLHWLLDSQIRNFVQNTSENPPLAYNSNVEESSFKDSKVWAYVCNIKRTGFPGSSFQLVCRLINIVPSCHIRAQVFDIWVFLRKDWSCELVFVHN